VWQHVRMVASPHRIDSRTAFLWALRQNLSFPPFPWERAQKKFFFWQMSDCHTSLPLGSNTRKGIPVDCVKERNWWVIPPFSLSFVDRGGTIILCLDPQKSLHRFSSRRCLRAVGICANIVRKDRRDRGPSDDGPDDSLHSCLTEQFYR